MESKKPKDGDIKLWHRIFYNNVCTQISVKEEEIIPKQQQLEKYKSLKTKVENMKNDLDEYSNSIKKIYEYTKNGISCVNFEKGIEDINEYYSNANNAFIIVDNILEQIKNEINRLDNEIIGLNNEISALKQKIGL